LSSEEMARLEESYFSTDAQFEELEIAEDELIDSYVRGELSKGERQAFEQSLLCSPRLMERLEFAQVMAHRLASSSAEVSPKVPIASKKSQDVSEGWWNRLFGLAS